MKSKRYYKIGLFFIGVFFASTLASCGDNKKNNKKKKINKKEWLSKLNPLISAMKSIVDANNTETDTDYTKLNNTYKALEQIKSQDSILKKMSFNDNTIINFETEHNKFKALETHLSGGTSNEWTNLKQKHIDAYKKAVKEYTDYIKTLKGKEGIV